MAKTLDTVTIQSTSMGTVSIVSNMLRYTPDAAFHGVARGTYTMSDGIGGSDSASWAIPVTKTGTRANGSSFAAVAQGAGAQDLDVLVNDVDAS